MLECTGASLSLFLSLNVRTRARARARVCVCVCVCVRACVRACVCVCTLRIVSTDKILRFTNTFIIIIMLKLMSVKLKTS